MLKTLLFTANIILGISFIALKSFPWGLVFLWILTLIVWLVMTYERVEPISKSNVIARIPMLHRGTWQSRANARKQVARFLASARNDKPNHRDILIALFLFLIALLPRIYHLGELPFGVFGDEAEFANMGQILLAKKTYLPFFDQTPTYFLYGIAFFNGLFSKTIFSTRLFAAIFGALNVSVFYFLAREKLIRFVSVSGALLFAFSYWYLVFSRLAFEHTMYLFFTLLSLWGVMRLINKRKNSVFLSTIAFGFGLSSYAAFRVVIFGYIAFLFFYYLKRRGQFRQDRRKILLIILGAVMINIPLIIQIARQPQEFFGHAQALSVLTLPVSFSIKIQEILINSVKNLGLIFGQSGDPNPRHNPGQIVMLNPLVTFLFITGIFIAWKKDKLTAFFLSIILFFSILPAVFSFEGFGGLNQPHAGRTISALPVIFLFTGYGIDFIGKLFKYSAGIKKVLIFIVIFVAVSDLFLYFNQKRTPDLARSYGVAPTEAAKLGKQSFDRGYKIYFPPRLTEESQIDFFVGEGNYQKWSGDIKKLPKKSVLILDLYVDQDLVEKEVLSKKNEWPAVPEFIDSENSGKPDIILFKVD